jgi:endonuclease/exonuclease/phosphatase family metal-dependent hydrolase
MILKKILLFFLLVPAMLTVTGQTFTVLTYNIRYDNPGDGQNTWALRKVWLCEQIKTINPGVFGIQEGLAHQVNFLDSALIDYKHIGVGRDDGKTKGEFSAIYYHAKKFRVIRQTTFWLSPTPRKVSVGWDAALERICTCGLFQEIATGRKFWVFNTHFDHVGVVARKNSAALILQKIKSMTRPGDPVILMGDFNSDPGSEAYTTITGLLLDSKTADKRMTMGPDGTFNGFDPAKPATERIDFIFTSKKNIDVLNYNTLRESRDGRYASDHYPVFAEIKIR